MASKRTIGIGCIVAPIALFFFLIVCTTIFSFIINSQVGPYGATQSDTAMKIMNVSIGFFAFLTLLIGIPAGLLTGIILLTSRPKQPSEPQNNTKL